VGNTIQQVEFFDADGVDLVQTVDDGNVTSAFGFKNVNDVVDGRITPDADISRIYFIFAHDSLDFIVIDMSKWDRVRNVQAALVLFLEGNVGWLFVDPDTKTFQLGFNDTLIGERLVHVEHNEDQVAGLRDSNDLPSSSSSVFGSLDNARQIDDL
jgi:hypothetical protein